MYRVPQRLYSWWRELDQHARVQASLVFGIGLLGLVHYLVFCIPQQFYIEDAGISFSYAKHLVEGEGLVTYPGGERVEGYSNPTWTFLVALFYAMGVPPWTSAKVMGAVFGFLTLPYVYGTTRRALHGRLDQETQSAQVIERGRRLDRLALLAPLLLVISPQFAIWNASGLENSLFCLLLAGGTYRVVLEGQETQRRLISPWWFALLAMTRPEGIVYGAIGFLAVFLGAAERRNWRQPLQWVALLLVPWGLYQWWRFTYFAWPFPNTYYGKLGKGTTFQPYEWSPSSWKVGWSYVKAYFQNHNILYFFPVMALGLSGWRIWNRPSSERVLSTLQWHAKEKRPVAQALGLLAAVVMIDAAFQPWLVGGTAPSSVFGASVDAETNQLMVLGHSSGPGIVALVLSVVSTLALALSRLRLAAFLAMMGVIWTGFSVGHYLMPDLVQDGNKGMALGMGPLVFGLGSLLVLTFSGGRSQWRSTVAAWLLMVVLLVLSWDGPTVDMTHPFYVPEILWPTEAKGWIRIRVWSLAAVAVLFGLLTVTHSGWRARGMLWASMLFGVFFSLYSGGDWMRQLRWFSLVSVSLMPLIAIGLATFIDAVPWLSLRLRLGHLWAPLAARISVLPVLPDWLGRRGVRLSLVLVLLGLYKYGYSEVTEHSLRFAKNPETGVRDIRRRVNYMSWVQRRLDIDHVTLLDVDMGAHMYFSGWDIVDIAGLVDVPMARHSDFNESFISEYIFGERNPEFAHVHGGWASTSKINSASRHPEWSERYLEIPGYPLGRQDCKNKQYSGQKCVGLHGGNHVRKDLFVDADQTLPDEAILFGTDVSLVDIDVPSPAVAPGGRLFIDSQWHRPKKGAKVQGRAGFRIVAILDDGQGHRATAVLPPGYDWYKPGWEEDEIVHGRYRMYIPRDLPHGEYELRLAILDEVSGQVLPVEADQGVTSHVFAEGEWASPFTVTLMSSDEAHKEARSDLRLAMETLLQGQCEEGWETWKNAERHVMKREEWRNRQRVRVQEAMAGCWINAAVGASDRDGVVDYLTRAMKWDHNHPELPELTLPLADQLEAEGEESWDNGDYELAYLRWSQTMALDPSRSWTRRRAEEARDRRLCIIRPGNNTPAELSAWSIYTDTEKQGPLGAPSVLEGQTQIRIWDQQEEERTICVMDRATRVDAYGVAAAEATDLSLGDASYAHLNSAEEEEAAVGQNASFETLEIKVSNETMVVGIQPLSAVTGETISALELSWVQNHKLLGFSITGEYGRTIDEWKELIHPVLKRVMEDVDNARSHLDFKLAENGKPSLDGAVAVVKKDGTVLYKGPQGETDIQDQIVVEVFDKKRPFFGADKPSEVSTIVIPVSSDPAEQSVVTHLADTSTCGCSASTGRGGWPWVISLLALMGFRRRQL